MKSQDSAHIGILNGSILLSSIRNDMTSKLNIYKFQGDEQLVKELVYDVAVQIRNTRQDLRSQLEKQKYPFPEIADLL